MPKGPNRTSFRHTHTARSPSINRRRPLPLTDTDHINRRPTQEFTPEEQSQITTKIKELTTSKLAGRRNTRKKYRKAKTKIRKSRKNIPKRGGGFTNETLAAAYKEIITRYTSIFPSLETKLRGFSFIPGFKSYLISIIDYLIASLIKEANATGYSNMSNEVQVKSILKPALDKVIAHQTGTVRAFITSNNITSDSILNAPTTVSQNDTTSNTYKTTRISVLLSEVDEYQLIPKLITDLQVFKAVKYNSGTSILEYEFKKTNPPTQIQDKPTLTETEKQEGLIPEQEEVLISGLEGEQPTKGGKKKSRARNKLYNAHKKMYSRRKTKHNHRY